MPTDPAAALTATTEAYQALRLAADPLTATYHGLAAHRDRLPELSADAEADRRRQLVALQQRVGAIDPAALSPTDATTRRMVLESIGHDLAWIDGDWTGLSVDDFDLGAQARLLFHLPRTTLQDPGHGEDHLRRMAAVGRYLDEALRRHVAAVRAGRTPPLRGVEAAIVRAGAAAAVPIEDDPLLAPFAGTDAGTRDHAAAVVREVVRPALARYAEGLAADVAPRARPDDRIGLCWLADGAERYRDMLRFHTSLSRPDPDEIHDAGGEEVAALHAEMAGIGRALYDRTDAGELAAVLRADPDLRYASEEALVADARAICGRAAEAATEVFGRLPATPCTVEPIPAWEAASAGAAFYQPPAPNRPHGTYWVNTTTAPLGTHEAEVTAFHEATPGHHTQVGIQTELDLPAFRRIGPFWSGFGEGWGLYTERLADERGWYRDGHSRLGMLIMQTARACRMVVDTGLHHHGWSRQRAVAYLRDNALLSDQLVRAEVDRYAVYPGQAPSYTVGALEIRRLRAESQRRLGGRFRLADFHDVVLGEGAVPLSALREMVQRWIDEVAGEAAG